MKIETLEKANELHEQISKLNEHILVIKDVIVVGKNDRPYRCEKKSFFAKLRLLNRGEKEEKKASVILFDNEHIGGYKDIEVDEEFLNYLSVYFEKKKERLEKELGEL